MAADKTMSCGTEHRGSEKGAAAADRSGSTGGWLTVSAVLLGALIVVQAGRMTGGSAAAAGLDVSVNAGDYSTMTCDGGNEDILLVLDHRTEQLMVYSIRNQRDLDFRLRQDVRDMFTTARNAAANAPEPGRKNSGR